MIRLAALFAAAALAVFGQPLDTILIDGTVLTVDGQSSAREAIAIRGSRM